MLYKNHWCKKTALSKGAAMQGDTDYRTLEQCFGVAFKDQALYKQALTSKGFHTNIDQDSPHNGTLEFLGDAALRFAVATYLFQRAPLRAEGTLTEVISIVVSGNTLARISSELELPRFANLDSEDTTTIQRQGPVGEKLLCDLLEGLVGAVVYEHGLQGIQQFLLNHLTPLCDKLLLTDRKDRISPRILFDELFRKKHRRSPRYQTFKKRRLPDQKVDTWVTEIYLGTAIFGRGSGTTARESVTAAARNGLDRHFPDSEKVA